MKRNQMMKWQDLTHIRPMMIAALSHLLQILKETNEKLQSSFSLRQREGSSFVCSIPSSIFIAINWIRFYIVIVTIRVIINGIRIPERTNEWDGCLFFFFKWSFRYEFYFEKENHLARCQKPRSEGPSNFFRLLYSTAACRSYTFFPHRSAPANFPADGNEMRYPAGQTTDDELHQATKAQPAVSK